ncbi:MAG: hypothetical protein WD530_06250 [Vicingaceae bacterium]
MENSKEDELFAETLSHVEVHQKSLNEVYRATVGLVNDIKNRSRRYMEQVSDVEEGLFEDDGSLDQQVQENIDKLTKNIEQFNGEINDYCKRFNKEIRAMVEKLRNAIDLYKEGKGSLSKLLEARKVLLYLDVSIRKFKNKINSLQLMNNALFSFSQEMKHIQEDYKGNLVSVSTEMTEAIESCNELIQEIESNA